MTAAPRRRRVGIRVAAILGATAALLATAGCVPAPDPSWTPPTFAVAQVRAVSARPPLDAATMAQQTGHRLRNDTLHVAARFAYLPGTSPAVSSFDDAVDAVVRAAIAVQAKAARTAYKPVAGAVGAGLADRGCVRGSTAWPAARVLSDAGTGPTGGGGTAVTCDVVAAAGTVFAERLRTVTGDASGVVADTTTTLFVDTATGRVTTGDALWTADAPAVLATDVVDALRRENGALSDAPAAAPDDAVLAAVRTALASAVPVAGGISVDVAAGFDSAQLESLKVGATAATMTLLVPSDVARGILTPAGVAILDASDGDYTGPGSVLAGDDRVDCTLEPCIALTYDDGPGDLTPQVLDALAARHAAATFFVIGSKVSPLADTVRREDADGHLVENHTWTHPHLPTLSSRQVSDEITRTTKAITELLGTPPRVFRPPYGQYTSSVLRAAALPAILWDVDSFDWTGTADAELTTRVVGLPVAGSIVLQHDIQANSVRTAGAVYDGLLDRGFSLVTVQQLFGGSLPTTGVVQRGPSGTGS